MATPTSTRKDPLPSFCFRVKIGGSGGESFFKSVSGMKIEHEVVPVREGGANDTTFQLPGAAKLSPIVLKQGFTKGSSLLRWRQDWLRGIMTRQGGTIYQLDTALKVVGQWEFVRGWPSKWEVGEYDAQKSELAIETLEITHEGLLWK